MNTKPIPLMMQHSSVAEYAMKFKEKQPYLSRYQLQEILAQMTVGSGYVQSYQDVEVCFSQSCLMNDEDEDALLSIRYESDNNITQAEAEEIFLERNNRGVYYDTIFRIFVSFMRDGEKVYKKFEAEDRTPLYRNKPRGILLDRVVKDALSECLHQNACSYDFNKSDFFEVFQAIHYQDHDLKEDLEAV